MIAKPQTALMNSLMHKSIPFVVAALFLISTGGGIRNKAYTAVAPPIYDPIAYYHKSRVVWDALSKGNFAGTLNGVKANRPPATALLLYPFGFTNSVRSFLFRSALLPIVLWTIALAIAVAVVVQRVSDAIVGGCLAVGLATMPLFYHFEYSDAFAHLYQISNQWGLVDPLQGAVAALAVCLLVVGIDKNSLLLCVGGWLLAALTFFIKPSGSAGYGGHDGYCHDRVCHSISSLSGTAPLHIEVSRMGVSELRPDIWAGVLGGLRQRLFEQGNGI